MFELSKELKYHKILLELTSRIAGLSRKYTIYKVDKIQIFHKSKTGRKIFENLDDHDTLYLLDFTINFRNSEIVSTLKYYTYIEDRSVFNLQLNTTEGKKTFGCILLETSAKADGIFRLIFEPVIKINEGGLIDDNEEEWDA